MQACWHSDVPSRPRFADLHIIFDQFLSHHTEELYPYIDYSFSTKPYKFDHLDPLLPANKQIKEEKEKEILNIHTEDYFISSTSNEGNSSSYASGSTYESQELTSFSPELSCSSPCSECTDSCQQSNGSCSDGQPCGKADTTSKNQHTILHRNKRRERGRSEKQGRGARNREVERVTSGTAKGPYDELRVEDYPCLSGKPENTKQCTAAAGGKIGGPGTDSSKTMPHQVQGPVHGFHHRDALMKTLSTITEASCEDEGFDENYHQKGVAYDETNVQNNCSQNI